MQLRIKNKILNIYADTSSDYDAILLTGSGTAAVEAMVTTFVPFGKKSLVVANGVYGERIAAMLAQQRKEYDIVKSDWMAPLDIASVEQFMKKNEYAFILTVHHETTTGRLNDIESLAVLSKKYNTPILLDAVSSFGGEKILFQDWNIGAVAATANKCLHAVPGISFVIARKSLLQSESHSVSVYLDLKKYYENQKTGFSPFTQSVQVLFALEEALDEMKECGGWEERHAQYLEFTGYLVDELLKDGIKLFLPGREEYSSILTSFQIPADLNYDDLHDTLKREGFIIYAGQGNFSGKIFRLAVMGDLTREDLTRLVKIIKSRRS